MQNTVLWDKCLSKLEDEIDAREFNTWLRPLYTLDNDDNFILYAPNRFIKDWLKDNLIEQLNTTAQHFAGSTKQVQLALETKQRIMESPKGLDDAQETMAETSTPFGTNVLKPQFSFENHIEGKSNQIARAATKQVSENPGDAYNPLFIYGGVGLGKTHLMHAAGNLIKANKVNARVAYVHSERFVSDMVKALEMGTMEKFKNYYRSLDALLIDDIQFFAGKVQSQ